MHCLSTADVANLWRGLSKQQRVFDYGSMLRDMAGALRSKITEQTTDAPLIIDIYTNGGFEPLETGWA